MERKRTSFAFLMEMLWVCGFFIVAACIFVLAFVKADQMSRGAKDLNQAVLTAENTMEHIFLWYEEQPDGSTADSTGFFTADLAGSDASKGSDVSNGSDISNGSDASNGFDEPLIRLFFDKNWAPLSSSDGGQDETPPAEAAYLALVSTQNDEGLLRVSVNVTDKRGAAIYSLEGARCISPATR